jgi:hypothetical protein
MKKYLGVIVLSVFSFAGWAQNQDPNSPGFDFGYEQDSSTVTEGSTDGYSVEGGEGEHAQEAPPPKPYERIVLSLDSLTNLITYTGIVEQEESGSDSIYWRAKKWANKVFANQEKTKNDPKGLYDIDKMGQKLVINGVLPAYSYSSKYTKQPIGTYQFKLTLLIKEGRYKYTITNFVHEGVKVNVGEPKRNYFEYYYTTTTNIKGVDSILRYADKDIQKMIENMKKALKEPLVVDEDEW